MLTQSYMPLQEDGLVDMQATSDKINSVSVFLLSENYEFHWREINFKAWRPVAPCSAERLGVRSAPPRGSMPFCVELDNLKDTDAPIHQPAAMLVAAD